MQTYKYQFPASGDVNNVPAFITTKLENKLKDGPNCLMAYCIFPTDSAILHHVDFETDDGSITALNLHTYTRLWDGMEKDLRDCVECNLEEITTAVSIDGNVKDLGIEGEVPDVLYRISQRKNMDSIMEKGIIPGIGSNSYKNTKDYAYLCEEKDLAPWLAVLKHLDEPVILEVKTKGLRGIEPGRTFTDRNYVPEGYGEYRTKETIPPYAIKEMELSGKFCEKMRLKMEQMVHLASSGLESDFMEVDTCMHRMKDMGIIYGQDMEGYADPITQPATGPDKEDCIQDKAGLADEGLPWDENDNGRPFIREDSVDDDFAKAVRDMSLSVSEFGVNM